MCQVSLPCNVAKWPLAKLVLVISIIGDFGARYCPLAMVATPAPVAVTSPLNLVDPPGAVVRQHVATGQTGNR